MPFSPIAALKSLFATEKKAVPLSDPGAFEIFGAAVPTSSGASVTTASAMRVPAAAQAVRLIAETVGSLPVKAYRSTGDGKEAAKDHAAFRIVHNRANEWTSAGQLRIDLTADALLHGAGFARVTRYGDGRPFELHRLEPSSVNVRTDESTGAPAYVITENGRQIVLPYTEVLHLSAFGGTSPIRLGREAIGVAMTLEKHAGQLFGSGARPGAMLYKDSKIAGPDGERAVGNMRRQWVADSANGFRAPFIADDGWRYQQIAFSSTDAQFLEHRLEQIREIARLFGVPPHMLFELDRATWSNAEEMGRSFLQLCLRPWLDRWQDAYNTVLFDEDERDDHFVEFVIDDLQRADAAGRADIFGKLIAARVMTPNEARAAMNLPSMAGGDALANPYTSTGTPPAPSQEAA
jgi:HK97 family phage portal protein